MSYGIKSSNSERFRYLIKHHGIWKLTQNWATWPEWDEEVTDVIWLQNYETMIASWWQMKEGRRLTRREPERVKDEELTMLLLQAENV